MNDFIAGLWSYVDGVEDVGAWVLIYFSAAALSWLQYWIVCGPIIYVFRWRKTVRARRELERLQAAQRA